MRYELSDDEWTTIGPMLPNKARGVPRVDAAGNVALTDEYPTRRPHPNQSRPVTRVRGCDRLDRLSEDSPAPSEQSAGQGHDQGDGGIDLMLGQLFARKDIILGVTVPDHIGEAPGQHRVTIVTEAVFTHGDIDRLRRLAHGRHRHRVLHHRDVALHHPLCELGG